MYTKIANITVLLISVLISSCNNHADILLQRIKETTILIPKEKLMFLHPYSNEYYSKNEQKYDYKFVVYSDSMDCSICEIKNMALWNNIIDDTKDLGVDVEYIFIFNIKKQYKKHFVDEYYQHRFNLSIYVDTTCMYDR